jgi:hypothetical protein
MNAKYKKSLKIVTLLISAIIIATASATTYSYMFIHGGATISTGILSWTLGTSAPSGAQINGHTADNFNFSIPQDTFQNFTDSLRLVNSDGSNGYSFDLSTDVTAGDTSKYTTFNMVVYDSGGAGLDSLDVLTEESTSSSLTIDASETLYIRFEIEPLTGESSGYLAFTVQLTYTIP